MRILIDECLNWRLSRALTGHYAVSAQKMGWGGESVKLGRLAQIGGTILEGRSPPWVRARGNATFLQASALRGDWAKRGQTFTNTIQECGSNSASSIGLIPPARYRIFQFALCS